MVRPDDHLERLISRKLDDELTPDESLELDKCLIRDPTARQSLEESQRIDRLTAALLDEVCAVQDEVQPPAINRPAARRSLRWFGAFPAAAAACVALIFVWPILSPSLDDSDRDGGNGGIGSAGIENDLPTGALDPDFNEPTMKLASHSDPPTKLRPLRERGTRLDYYGVLDPDTQKLYLLEVKHQTSAQRPDPLRQRGSSQGGVRLASHDM